MNTKRIQRVMRSAVQLDIYVQCLWSKIGFIHPVIVLAFKLSMKKKNIVITTRVEQDFRLG